MNNLVRKILEETANRLTSEKLEFASKKDRDNPERIKWFKAVEESYLSELEKLYNSIVENNDFSQEETIAVATNLKEQVTQNKGITGINIAQVEKIVLSTRRDRENIDRGSIGNSDLNKKMDQVFDVHKVDVNVDKELIKDDLKKIENEKLMFYYLDNFFSKYDSFIDIEAIEIEVLGKMTKKEIFESVYNIDNTDLLSSYYITTDEEVEQQVEKSFLLAERMVDVYSKMDRGEEFTVDDYKEVLSLQGGMLLVNRDPLNMVEGIETVFSLAKSISNETNDEEMKESFSLLFEDFKKQKENGLYDIDFIVRELEETCKKFGIEFNREYVDKDLTPEEQHIARAKMELMEMDTGTGEYSLDEFNEDLKNIQEGKSISKDRLKIILDNGLFVTYSALMKSMEKNSIDKSSYEAMKEEEKTLNIDSDEIANNSKLFLDASINNPNMGIKETVHVNELISKGFDFLYNNTSGKEDSFKSMDELIEAIKNSYYISTESKDKISKIYNEKKSNPDELRAEVDNFLRDTSRENSEKRKMIVVDKNIRLKTYMEAKQELGDDTDNQKKFLETICNLSSAEMIKKRNIEIDEDYLNKLRDEGHLKAYSVIMKRFEEKGKYDSVEGVKFKEVFEKRTQEDEKMGIFTGKIYDDIEQNIRNEMLSKSEGIDKPKRNQGEIDNYGNSTIEEDGR